MLSVSPATRIFLALSPIDMRKARRRLDEHRDDDEGHPHPVRPHEPDREVQHLRGILLRFPPRLPVDIALSHVGAGSRRSARALLPGARVNASSTGALGAREDRLSAERIEGRPGARRAGLVVQHEGHQQVHLVAFDLAVLDVHPLLLHPG